MGKKKQSHVYKEEVVTVHSRWVQGETGGKWVPEWRNVTETITESPE